MRIVELHVSSMICVVVHLSYTVPRIELKELEQSPELADRVAWSHQAQCYYKPVPGRSVSWYATIAAIS